MTALALVKVAQPNTEPPVKPVQKPPVHQDIAQIPAPVDSIEMQIAIVKAAQPNTAQIAKPAVNQPAKKAIAQTIALEISTATKPTAAVKTAQPTATTAWRATTLRV